MSEDIFEQIAQKYNDLSKTERRIADYVLKYKDIMQPMTSEQIATACGVSNSSVTRFCRSIGKKDFSDFKWSVSTSLASAATHTESDIMAQSMLDVYDEVRAEDSIEQKCQKLSRIGIKALTQTLEKIDVNAIDQAVVLLCRARNVYCFGQGNSSIVASDAWGRFASVTTKFHWISDSHMQAYTASLLGAEDVILYFSFSGVTRELAETEAILQKTDAKLILVTRFPNSPGAKNADVTLVCGVSETPRQQGSIAAKIGQLFIIDVLFNEFCARNLEMIVKNQAKTLDTGMTYRK